MYASLDRIILYVQDVERLASFYRDAFQLPIVEEIKGEWAVLQIGACQLALHRVGAAYRVDDTSSWQVETNAKLVISVTRDVRELRAELVRKGVPMREIKSFPGLTGPLCDGTDPEGNVFQLAQIAPNAAA
jgi:predicted enzyme related to lactoylglutathione lyase